MPRELGWLELQTYGKEYWSVSADYITYPIGQRTYVFPSMDAANKFAEGSSLHPGTKNVKITEPNGREIDVDSKHKHAVQWVIVTQDKKDVATETLRCPKNIC